MAFKPSYNIMDRDTHNALVNAFKTGGIGYTDDDGSVHKIADDYVSGGGGGGGGSAYDIIFQVKTDPDQFIALNNISLTDIEIVNGSIEALEQKLLNGERVSGIFEVITSYGGNGYDTYFCWQMAKFDAEYREIRFGAFGNGAPNGGKVVIHYASDYTPDNITFES